MYSNSKPVHNVYRVVVGNCYLKVSFLTKKEKVFIFNLELKINKCLLHFYAELKRTKKVFFFHF